MNAKIEAILNKYYTTQELDEVYQECVSINIGTNHVVENQFFITVKDNFKAQRDQSALKEVIELLNGKIVSDFFSFIGCYNVEFREKIDLNLFRNVPSIFTIEPNGIARLY